tara:strand:+ start:3006 stop:3410 length:405 start_codon:yes stop_codon:yes gene_type:complete
MSIFTKLFSKGATDLVKEVGSVVDDLTTTKEEKLEAKRKLEDLLLNFEKSLQIEVSKRWEQDMNSDSWLSKNIRPLTLIFLVFCTLILIFIDSGFIEFEVKQNWIDLLQIILITIIGAYFGGRSFEKIKRLNDK